MLFAQFQQIDRTDQVVVDQLPGTAAFGCASENRGIRSAVQNPVNRREGFDVVGLTDVSSSEINTQFLKDGFIYFDAWPRKVV